MKIKLLTTLLFIVSFTYNSYAQVTIGSNEEPSAGALLDLRSTEKGLLLPRTSIKSYNSLQMGNSESNYSTQKIEHTGLMVYNVNENFDECDPNSIPPGLYVWNGDRWIGLNISKEYSDSTSLLPSDPLFEPNCFVQKQGVGGVINISTKKAFRVWEFWTSTEGNNRLGNTNPISVTDKLSTSIVWMDNANVIGSPIISTINQDTLINVPVGTSVGNAVVALHIGPSGTIADPIRWSWHIWITDADINLAAQQKPYNGLTFMDRNLGALNAIKQDAGSKGTLYQWGRKDPIPSSSDWSNTDPNLSIGGPIPIVQSDLDNASINLLNSITQPLGFIVSDDDETDWYGLADATPKDRWDTRWNEEYTNKCGKTFHISSITNPCPKGWKVPVYKGSGLDNSESPWYKDGVTNTEPKSYTPVAMNKGYSFEEADYNLGWYPNSSFRTHNTGRLSTVGSNGAAWAGSADNMKSHAFYFRNNSISPWSSLSRGNGFSVRCVKE